MRNFVLKCQNSSRFYYTGQQCFGYGFIDSGSGSSILLYIYNNFRLNTDPDPIRIQGFDDQKLKEFTAEDIFLSKLQFAHP